MQTNTLRAIASFPTGRELLIRVNTLEQELGLPKTQPPCTVSFLRSHVAKLEKVIADKTEAARLSVADPALTVKELHGLQRSIAAVRIEGQGKPLHEVPAGMKGRDRFKASMRIQGISTK